MASYDNILEMKERKWEVSEVDTTSTNGPENITNQGENTWEKGSFWLARDI